MLQTLAYLAILTFTAIEVAEAFFGFEGVVLF
jgi:hypothetical protein